MAAVSTLTVDPSMKPITIIHEQEL
jgi:hypothetical protein